jgi:hypothetical protein
MALIRDRIAKVDPHLANPDLGTSLDVTLFSPFLTAEPN